MVRFGIVGLLVLVLALRFLNPPSAAAIGVVATIPLGGSPQWVAMDATTNTIYVTNGTGVSVIDGATNTVTATVPTGNQPDAVAVNVTTHLIYVTNAGPHTVSVIDGATNAVTATIPMGDYPHGVAVDATTNTIYVTNGTGVSVIDGTTNTVTANVSTGNQLYGVAVDATSHTIYVINGTGVSVIDGATNTVTATVTVGDQLYRVAVDATTHLIYVSNYVSNTVIVIDGATNAVTTTIPVEGGPDGVAVDATTDTVYVTNNTGNTVAVIDGATNAVTASIPVGLLPYGVAVDATTHLVYVANSGFGTRVGSVSVIDPATPTVLVGDTTVEASIGGLLGGTAKAYPYVATSSGTLGHLNVYLDGTNQAQRFQIGLYADSGTSHPGALLTSRLVTNAVAGQWNTVSVAPVSVVAGQTYWIALLSGGQVVRIRDTAHGGLAELSQETTLHNLPATWTPGSTVTRAPASAYGSQ